MYFGGNNHGCQEYSKNLYKYTQADRLIVTPLNSSESSSILRLWKDSLTDVPASVKMGLAMAESLPAGSGEDCFCWRVINRLGTGVGHAKTMMRRWGYLDDAQSVVCACGEPRKMAFKQCMQLRFRAISEV